MVATLGLLVSCSPSEKEVYGEWTIVEVKGQPAVGEETPMLGLEEGRVYGNTGCNSFSGTLVLDGDNMSFTQVGITGRLCADADTEVAILEAVNTTKTYQVQEDSLFLFNEADDCIMKLAK